MFQVDSGNAASVLASACDVAAIVLFIVTASFNSISCTIGYVVSPYFNKL